YESSPFISGCRLTATGSGGPTDSGPQVDSNAKQNPRAEDSARHGLAFRAWLVRLRAIFHRRGKPAVLSRQPAPPSVVLACANCGFDYTVTRVEAGDKAILLWTCECRSQFILPGGTQSFELVRP
ncbi:MAG: hypothetical protein L3J78_00815, partial [Thermoplasmata archaeon]|nr:hypothetical protein [Thermoplasmata archaeon]